MSSFTSTDDLVAEEEPIRSNKTTQTDSEMVPNRDLNKRFSKPTSMFPYTGVRQRRWGRYVSEIRIPKTKTRIWLGSFESPEMAARAYDSAAFYLKGKSAVLNFPKFAGTLPAPISSSHRDIKIAAAKAALVDSVPNRGDEFDHDSVSLTKSGLSSEEDWWFSDDEMLSFFNEVQDSSLHGSFRLEPVAGNYCYAGVVEEDQEYFNEESTELPL